MIVVALSAALFEIDMEDAVPPIWVTIFRWAIPARDRDRPTYLALSRESGNGSDWVR